MLQVTVDLRPHLPALGSGPHASRGHSMPCALCAADCIDVQPRRWGHVNQHVSCLGCEGTDVGMVVSLMGALGAQSL